MIKTVAQSFKDYYDNEYFFEHMTLLLLGAASVVLTITVYLSGRGSVPSMVNLYEGIQSIY